MTLAKIRLNTAVAYPIVEPPLSWAIGALLIWDKITIIWDPDDIDHLKDYATRTPVLLDHGFVEIEKPQSADVTRASQGIESLLRDASAQPPTDNEFASTFALHPVKVTGAYWEHSRRSADGFVHVPPQLGSLYVGLLAQEMATRAGAPTICMRYEEPLFLAGATSAAIGGMTPADCVARASLEVLEVTLKGDNDSTESSRAEEASKDIAALRRLDGWYSWRELMCEYLDALAGTTPDKATVAATSSEMRSAIRKYQKEASRQKWATIGKIGVTVAGGVVGFFVGAVPGAIAGAATGGAMLGIDLYQTKGQNEEHRAGWQHFVLAARGRFS